MSEVTVGVCAHTHDSSSALFVEDELVGFLEEDRLVGRKHTREFPSTAIRQLLDAASLGPDQVTQVAYTFCRSLYAAGRDHATRRPGDARRRRRSVASYNAIEQAHDATLRRLAKEFPSAKVSEVPHHVAHALSAIAPQGWADRSVLVVDSIGEAVTTSVGQWDRSARSLGLTALAWDTDSLGYIYGAVTDHLGYRMRDEEGTVMALAAFGDPARFRDLFQRVIPLTADGFRVSTRLVRQRVFGDKGDRLTAAFVRAAIPRREPGQALAPVHADLAASLQERVEQVIVHLVRRHPSPAREWAAAGGVATNCVAFGKLREMPDAVDVYIPPAPGDAGTSLGAAAAVILGKSGALARVPASPYWGVTPEIPSARELHDQGLAVSGPHADGELAGKVAVALTENKIVGVYRGAAEAGPRALGHRSILASPLAPGVHDRLANEIKRREAFRPFAPIVMADRADEFFELHGGESPYMSLAVGARRELVEHAPSVVHRNSTARVQTVRPGTEAFLEAALREYERLSGSPLLMNTSLNIKGEPTAGDWQSAVRCLTDMPLDGLVLGDLYVTRPITKIC